MQLNTCSRSLNDCSSSHEPPVRAATSHITAHKGGQPAPIGPSTDTLPTEHRPNGPLEGSAVFSQVAIETVSEYHAWKAGRGGESQAAGSTSVANGGKTRGKGKAGSGRAGKQVPAEKRGERARQSDRDNTPAPAPVTTNGESGQEQKERALLACPFWKNNPLRHRACYRGFKRIRDVKYHLKRNHVRPRCPRCGTQFDQVGAVSTHLRNPQEVCARRDDLDDIPYDSISPEQAMTLSQYSDRTYSQEQQWFAIWDIVFHGHPQPMSAYVDTDMSADLSSYHTFSSTHGVYFISERLHDHGYTTVPRDLVQDVLRESQDLIYNSWVQEWQRGSPSSTQSAESSSGTPQSTSTGDPSVSGVNGFPATPVQLDDDNNWYTPTSFDFFAHDPDNMGG